MEDLRGLSLEELSAVQISSVSRRLQPLDQAPAAAYVITSEDIRRSGATSLPEALRLAPNLSVARDAGNSWAVTARGFNSTETANKLLVLVDTRSIYSTLHAGVFWDEEMVFVEDIERIEVISGPGGALWGANAVNGVINVITKNAADVQGVAGRVTLGTVDNTASARVGGRLGNNGHFRLYGSAFDFGDTLTPAGARARDGFAGGLGGFRADWNFDGDTTATLHVEAFDENIPSGDLWGGYVRGRVTHNFDSGHRLFVQAYYDRATRKDPFLNDTVESYDITFQHNWAPMGAHQIITGGGYRVTEDNYILPGPFHLLPTSDSQELWNAFIQDTLTLGEVTLTAGVKFEDSSFSGFEYLPSARVSWTPAEGHLLWAAVSRAVRTPVRIDRDLVWPGFFLGGPNFKSEELIAYETGYRTRADRFGFSISAFLHDYDDLRTTSPLNPPPAFILPAEFRNALSGQSYGVEVWGDYELRDWWRLSAGLTALEKDYSLDPGFYDIAGPPSTGADPSYQFMLHSRMNITPDVEFDAGLRWVDELDAAPVPEYVELEARLAWRVTERMELSLVGVNLLHESHLEMDSEPPANRIRRGVYLGASWGF